MLIWETASTIYSSCGGKAPTAKAFAEGDMEPVPLVAMAEAGATWTVRARVVGKAITLGRCWARFPSL